VTLGKTAQDQNMQATTSETDSKKVKEGSLGEGRSGGLSKLKDVN